MFRVIDALQRSPEWHAARLGRITGSCASDAFTQTKSGWGAGRRNLRTRLVLERLTGQSQENGFVSTAMARGIELEDEARAAYEAETGILLEEVGFVQHTELMAGCSPDGLWQQVGGVEVKCPGAAVHLEYLRGKIPNDYRVQMLHTLWIAELEWLDFVSYHPDFPEALRLKITRIHADKAEIKAHNDAVIVFLDEVESELQDVLGMLPDETVNHTTTDQEIPA